MPAQQLAWKCSQRRVGLSTGHPFWPVRHWHRIVVRLNLTERVELVLQSARVDSSSATVCLLLCTLGFAVCARLGLQPRQMGKHRT